MIYRVSISAIGTVYEGPSYERAGNLYRAWVRLVKDAKNYQPAIQEDANVVLFQDEEVKHEFNRKD